MWRYLTKIEINIRCVHSANWRAKNVAGSRSRLREVWMAGDTGIKRGMYGYYSRGEFDFAREVTRRRSIWHGEKSRVKTKGIELLCTRVRHARSNAKIITWRAVHPINTLPRKRVCPINILSNNWPRPFRERVAARNMTVDVSVMIKSIKRNGVIVANIRWNKPSAFLIVSFINLFGFYKALLIYADTLSLS